MRRWKKTLGITVRLSVLCAALPLESFSADVTFRWDFSQPGVAGFALHCGVTTRNYTTHWDAGNKDTFTVPLQDGAAHFCAVTAYDAEGVEGYLSNEVAAVISEDTGAVAVAPTLTVGGQGAVSPTATGFRIAFNQPFDPRPLNLIESDERGVPDVNLVGATTGVVRGSLVVDDNNQSLMFVKTGGTLVPDAYTLWIGSRFDGLIDLLGRPLDNNGDGIFGDDYNLAFAVLPSAAPVLSVGEFARGPGQTANLPATDTAAGIPVRISNGTAVRDVAFTLRYNPRLLSVRDVKPVIGILTLASIDDAAGLVRVRVENLSGLTSASTVLVRLQAQVPTDAPYGSQHVLDISDLNLNGGSLTGRDDDGLHLVAKPGDASGARAYSSTDATLIQRVIVRIDSGFSAYPLTDPVLVGDVNENGRLDAADALLVQYKALGRVVPQFPD